MIKQGDIYYFDLSGAKGSEQQGIRPCLVMSNNDINTYSNILIVVPLTTKKNDHYVQHYNLKINNRQNTILFEQIRAIDKRRIVGKMTSLDNDNLTKILKKINKIFIGEKKNDTNLCRKNGNFRNVI